MMNSFRSGVFIIIPYFIEILINHYYYYWELHISCEFPLPITEHWIPNVRTCERKTGEKKKEQEIEYKHSNGFLRFYQDVPNNFLFLLNIFMIRLSRISFAPVHVTFTPDNVFQFLSSKCTLIISNRSEIKLLSADAASVT